MHDASVNRTEEQKEIALPCNFSGGIAEESSQTTSQDSDDCKHPVLSNNEEPKNETKSEEKENEEEENRKEIVEKIKAQRVSLSPFRAAQRLQVIDRNLT